jgi:ATP-dependent Clp protease ATP-binding subunit ClpC
MITPEQNKKLKTLIKKAVELLNDQKHEEAKPFADEILQIDPDSADGHIIAAYASINSDEDAYYHFKFVMDRDLNHIDPVKTGYPQPYVAYFFNDLVIRSYHQKDEDSKKVIYDEILDYSIRLLTAGHPVPRIEELMEALERNDRFDDIINLGFFLTNDKTAAEIGWPGLDRCSTFNKLESVQTPVLFAFLKTKRYEEGCQWIFKCLMKKPDEFYLWYQMGMTLAWLGHPGETARAWIIAVEKGFYYINQGEIFSTLASIVADPDYPEKEKLFLQFYHLGKKIPEELKEIYDEIYSAFSVALRYPDKPVPLKKYIEEKLGMELKDDRPGRYNRWSGDDLLYVAPEPGKYPIVQEIIDMMDQHIGSGNSKTGNNVRRKPGVVNQNKDKVLVGSAPSEPVAITLSQFGINITEQVRKGEIPPIIGRDREIERMVRILARSEKNNPVLLGEAGVGKTAAVYGLAQRIVSGDVPEVLKNKTLIELNVGSLVAGTTYRGDFEERMNNILNEMREDPNKILFIDEFHTLIGAGDSKGQLDASNILKPALSSGEIRLIGATTSREYSRSIEHDAAFERRFSPVWLNEISQQVTYAILRARVPFWKEHHHVLIPHEILKASIQLTEQYIKHRHFPDKAIEMIDEACALARISSITADNESVILTQEHMKKVCNEWIGATGVRSRFAANFTEIIEQQLQAQVVGHPQVLKSLSMMVTDEKLGLFISKLPRVLYFYGLSDTGKTECARILAKVLWPGEKERFVYIDMELFEQPSDLNRLVGAPIGTIGSEEGGRLSTPLGQQPFSLIYLRNFHKAHDRIIRFFVNLFKEGLFSDGNGRTIYCGNVIFILSATVEAQAYKIGYNPAKSTQATMPWEDNIPDALGSLKLPKELFHFVKETFYFNELTEPELRMLIERKINAIIKQPGIKELEPHFDESLVENIIRQYMQQPPSSRNLRGMLQKYVYPAIKENF